MGCNYMEMEKEWVPAAGLHRETDVGLCYKRPHQNSFPSIPIEGPTSQTCSFPTRSAEHVSLDMHPSHQSHVGRLCAPLPTEQLLPVLQVCVPPSPPHNCYLCYRSVCPPPHHTTVTCATEPQLGHVTNYCATVPGECFPENGEVFGLASSEVCKPWCPPPHPLYKVIRSVQTMVPPPHPLYKVVRNVQTMVPPPHPLYKVVRSVQTMVPPSPPPVQGHQKCANHGAPLPTPCTRSSELHTKEVIPHNLLVHTNVDSLSPPDSPHQHFLHTSHVCQLRLPSSASAAKRQGSGSTSRAVGRHNTVNRAKWQVGREKSEQTTRLAQQKLAQHRGSTGPCQQIMPQFAAVEILRWKWGCGFFSLTKVAEFGAPHTAGCVPSRPGDPLIMDGGKSAGRPPGNSRESRRQKLPP
uniref:Uncharacterized protein n=1 Tax=Branchiostoma floridae TaxID=7739 RepID=C3YF98_BRAFL|eukprot:XP_002605090.1 hypothetical protein BRAFLDRAFT_85237 [Branchiostoma floridae]